MSRTILNLMEHSVEPVQSTDCRVEALEVENARLREEIGILCKVGRQLQERIQTLKNKIKGDAAGAE